MSVAHLSPLSGLHLLNKCQILYYMLLILPCILLSIFFLSQFVPHSSPSLFSASILLTFIIYSLFLETFFPPRIFILALSLSYFEWSISHLAMIRAYFRLCAHISHPIVLKGSCVLQGKHPNHCTHPTLFISYPHSLY